MTVENSISEKLKSEFTETKKLFELAVSTLCKNESFCTKTSEPFIRNRKVVEFEQGVFVYRVEIGNGVSDNSRVDEIRINKKINGRGCGSIHIGISYDDIERTTPYSSGFNYVGYNEYGNPVENVVDASRVSQFIKEINPTSPQKDDGVFGERFEIPASS